MKKVLTIAKWEYLEKIKTKAFIISIIITPLIILLFSILPTVLAQKEDLRTKVIGVVDTSGIYFNPLKKELEEYKIKNNQLNYVLVNLNSKNKTLKQINQKQIKMFFNIALKDTC